MIAPTNTRRAVFRHWSPAPQHRDPPGEVAPLNRSVDTVAIFQPKEKILEGSSIALYADGGAMYPRQSLHDFPYKTNRDPPGEVTTLTTKNVNATLNINLKTAHQYRDPQGEVLTPKTRTVSAHNIKLRPEYRDPGPT